MQYTFPSQCDITLFKSWLMTFFQDNIEIPDRIIEQELENSETWKCIFSLYMQIIALNVANVLKGILLKASYDYLSKTLINEEWFFLVLLLNLITPFWNVSVIWNSLGDE